MTDRARLGAADAAPAFFGVTPARLGCFGVVAASVVAWVISPSWWLVLLASMAVVASVPGPDRVALVSYAARAVRHVFAVRAIEETSVTVDGAVFGRGTVPSRRWRLEHRGRLDLVDADLAVADMVRDLLDSLAATGGGEVVVVTRVQGGGFETIVRAPESAQLPTPWRRVDCAGPFSKRALVRWGYVRNEGGVARVLRVAEFAERDDAEGLLARAWRESPTTQWSVHYEVLGLDRGRRMSERASHRAQSDALFATTLGFRRSHRVRVAGVNARQREAETSSGRALVRVAVLVTVTATTLENLRHGVSGLRRRAASAGLRLDRGFGRQGSWWSAAGLEAQ